MLTQLLYRLYRLGLSTNISSVLIRLAYAKEEVEEEEGQVEKDAKSDEKCFSQSNDYTSDGLYDTTSRFGSLC